MAVDAILKELARVDYSNKFTKKIEEIYREKSKYSLCAYKKIDKLLMDKLDIIKMFPKAYAQVKHKYNLRKIPLDNYIILYSVQNNNVFIEDIIHQKSKKFNNQEKD